MTFSSKPSYNIQNSYIKDKFLASVILYKHGASKPVQE